MTISRARASRACACPTRPSDWRPRDWSLGLAWFGIQQLIEIAPANLPRRHRSARPDVIELLRASGRTAGTGSASLLRSRAVVLEVALSFILLMAPAW